MLLAQGRYWRATIGKARDTVILDIVGASLPGDLKELSDLRIDIPLVKWNRLAKNVHSDRKLVAGLLIDFAKHKEHVVAAVSSDRLLSEYQRVVLDATTVMIETGLLVLERAAETEE